ncbi:hypothetical protein ACXR0O_08235 [Verrucomicrobiota bacterium sgz303538]
MKRALLIAFVCTLPLSTRAQEQPGPERIVMGLDFSDAPLKTVLKYYGHLSKQPVLAQIDLDLEIWVNIVKNQEMTVSEAKALIRETLRKRHLLEIRESDSGEILVSRVKEPQPAARSYESKK